ncbi:MATE family efflux transporter [Enterobacter hormaechei]
MALLTSADKALWRLALPMIFSNITVPLLGLVDTAVIGHLDSPIYLGGVAIGATATSFLFMLLLFLRMSTTGLTAQAYGAKDPLRLARALVQPLILAFGAGALIVLLRTPLIDLALHIVGGSDAYWNKPGGSSKFAGSARPLHWQTWSFWAGCWACSTPARQ